MDEKTRAQILGAILAATCAMIALSFQPGVAAAWPAASMILLAVSSVSAIAALAALLVLLLRRPVTFSPDVNAITMFDEVLNDSKWQSQHSKWLGGTTGLGGVDKLLDHAFHDAMKKGKITAWGYKSLPEGGEPYVGPLSEIASDQWQHSAICFRDQQRIVPISRPIKSKDIYAMHYIDIRFSRRQVRSVFPRASNGWLKSLLPNWASKKAAGD